MSDEERSITAPEIAAIRERLGKASAGPWSTNGKTQLGWRIDTLGEGRRGIDFLLHPTAIVERYEDAEFIASARDDVPLLLDSLDTVTAERDEARNELRLLAHAIAAFDYWVDGRAEVPGEAFLNAHAVCDRWFGVGDWPIGEEKTR